MREDNRKRTSDADWEELKGRIAAARVEVGRDRRLTPEQERAVLKARAAALAAVPEAEIAGERIEIVEFLLAGEQYGLETSLVSEVWPLRELTPLPCAPAHVAGIINVRGRILSVIDLKKFFDLPEKGLGELNKVIILTSDAMEFGVLADSILGVRELLKSGLRPRLPTFSGVGGEYLLGLSEDRTIVLDARKILSDDKIVVNEEV